MSELTLTLLRLGLLVALWLFVFGVLNTLRRDLVTDSAVARRRPAQPAKRRERGLRRRKGAHINVTLFDGSTRRLPLGSEAITFGRGTENTIVLDDDYTSTHHARIVQRERGWIIEDLGSTNGTWVGRKRITSATPLSSGMRVRIGKSEIVVGS